MPPPRSSPRIHPLGDAAALVDLGRRLDTALNTRCLHLAAALRKHHAVREAIAGYASVVVHYDPEQISFRGLSAAVRRLAGLRARAAPVGRLHRIPVAYDGPDLEATADALKLEVRELVRLHTAPYYRVFMVGFVPGWAYLGPLDPRLELPRRRVPRTSVPAGSVAIAGLQTGVYPLPTPGGWHLIGTTSVPMFLPQSDPPSLLRPGDRVRFFASAG
ncbi:MAG TPA: 5-oxoprolinase subunit PxpB [Candidatus Acidoferrales bacterium]|nr:5-oxoprolinase subunit PxpB [Candidatus Acidoferrales bacterium]